MFNSFVYYGLDLYENFYDFSFFYNNNIQWEHAWQST